VISAKGLEGGGIYAVSRDLRDGATLALDLLPEPDRSGYCHPPVPHEARRKHSEPVAQAWPRQGAGRAGDGIRPHHTLRPPETPAHSLQGPRPLDEAISVAGGVEWTSVTESLELKALPRTFVAGEMLDWEAPTGGYLLTACWATGRWAGQNAARSVLAM
jgi:predicted flavoprotein YhiN